MSKSQNLSPEQEIIKELFEPLTHIGHPCAPELGAHSPKTFIKRTRKPLTFGLRDDAACLTPPENKDIIISKDLLVESVHFIGTEAPGLIASKALRTNLSDIASKGAIPYGYMLGLTLGKGHDKKWLDSFCEGLKRDQKNFQIPLLGGDITKTNGPLMISITILGLCDQGAFVTRDGAQIDDVIYTTGSIGDAALGLKLALNLAGLKTDDSENNWISDITPQNAEYLIDRYQLPLSRNVLAPEIAKFCTSSMDISDGLVRDCISLCEASGVGAIIKINQIPLSDTVKDLLIKHETLIDLILTGGDDYEILCTVPKKLSHGFEQACLHKSCPVTPIGLIGQGQCKFMGKNGKPMKFDEFGYSHL